MAPARSFIIALRLQNYSKSVFSGKIKLGRKEGMANDYGNLGTLYLTRGALKEAEKMYKKSLAIYKSLENKDMIKKVKSWIEELEGLRKEKEK